MPTESQTAWLRVIGPGWRAPRLRRTQAQDQLKGPSQALLERRSPPGRPVSSAPVERRAMKDIEGDVSWDGHRTWYRQRGELAPGGPVPIVLLHGGPGGTH